MSRLEPRLEYRLLCTVYGIIYGIILSLLAVQSNLYTCVFVYIYIIYDMMS